MSTALTTKARVKERLEITVTTFDDVIDSLILQVTGRIERMCGRHFMQATYTEELYDGSDPAYGTPRTALIVKNAPIASIDALEYNRGTNADPDWVEIDEDDYTVGLADGILFFDSSLPYGRRNIRITYTGGYTGFSIGIANYWEFNVSAPDIGGAVNGSNLTFTLPENASQIIVYADGMREASSNITFTSGTATFTLAAGRAPFSTLSVDYLPSAADSENDDDIELPMEVVGVCEEVVSRLFKRRKAEGRASETLGESTITYTENVFTKENLATIKNFRRGNYI